MGPAGVNIANGGGRYPGFGVVVQVVLLFGSELWYMLEATIKGGVGETRRLLPEDHEEELNITTNGTW